MNERYTLSENDLKDHLRRQLILLASSVEAFDRGVELEATRMAVIARVLFHHTGASHSLIRQLNIEDTLLLPDSGEAFPPAVVNLPNNRVNLALGSFFRLAHLCINQNGVLFAANLPIEPEVKFIGFSDWWNTEILRASKKEFKGEPWSMTRRSLVLGLANKEGGAHVDPRPTFDWWVATRAQTFGTVQNLGNGRFAWETKLIAGDGVAEDLKGDIVSPVFSSMRTIAEEMLSAFEKHKIL